MESEQEGMGGKKHPQGSEQDFGQESEGSGWLGNQSNPSWESQQKGEQEPDKEHWRFEERVGQHAAAGSHDPECPRVTVEEGCSLAWAEFCQGPCLGGGDRRTIGRGFEDK
jgi:hypothetical protein